jgi:hypothetical protein
MMRIVTGIVLGVVASLLILAGIDHVEDALYPLPTVDFADAGSLASIVNDMPFPAKLLTVLGWFAAAFGGGWLGLRVCDVRWVGWAVVIVVVAAAVTTVTTLPHPLWMKVCAVALPMLGGALAGWAHRKPYAGEALLG